MINGLNIQEIFWGSINSDCKIYLPNVFSFRQNLLIYSNWEVQIYLVPMGITMVWTVMEFRQNLLTLKLVCHHWSQVTDLEKTCGSVKWKISMVVETVMFQYPFQIKANYLDFQATLAI